ncbi:MAG: bifunctional UDP-N-acetylglucosamine diphosphorylase/glucosamine-1-phosphate N-acetyltransferase GlmU, partial [Pseudomonadota bacterium]
MAQLASLILAAGHGTRMRSTTPKVLHEVGRGAMLHHVMGLASGLGAAQQVVVVGSQAEKVEAAAHAFDPEVRIAVQDPPQGTGDAVSVAMPCLEGFDGIALILYADTPLITKDTCEQLIAALKDGAAVAVLGFEPDVPGAYGRLIQTPQGDLDRIVEAKEASPEELAVGLCNSGVMAVQMDALRTYLPQITNENAKGEYYLTDLAALVTKAGERAVIVTGSQDEVYGVNDRLELAEAEKIFQVRARRHLMQSGVTLRDPDSVYLSYDTVIASDVVVGQNVVFGPGVTVETGVHIEAFSHLESCHVKANAAIGPFARLRPGAIVGEGAKIGNFVEIKKTTLHPGAKVSHLTYLGDATVGEDANIGAGTITCNYDGFSKFKTEIGKGAFVG